MPQPATGFADLGVPAPIVSALAARGIESAFPIQQATLPDALRGRDVLGRGRTGSGKTLAFGIPTLVRLAGAGRTGRRGAPRALVLVPTRELATQVHAALAPLAASLGLRTMTVFGGVGMQPQITALRKGVDVCVATPGRLEDLIARGHARLDAVEITVIDEADHMADLGFLPPVRRLLDQTPPRGQRMLFSATLDRGVDVLVRRYLTDPVTHSVDSADSPVPDMAHHVLLVAAADKGTVVQDLVSGQGRTLAFTRTKHGAKKLARTLTAAGVPAVDLHGNLSQAARDRNLASFGTGRVRVLVATDIAARGIHVDDIRLVVHVDPPAEHKAYLHRSGRTARAGAAGTVVTVGTPDQRADVRTLLRQASITAQVHTVTLGHPVLDALVGERADHVAPTAPRDTVPAAGTRTGQRTSQRRPAAHASGRGSGSRRSSTAPGSTAPATTYPAAGGASPRRGAAAFSAGSRSRGRR